MSGLPHQYPFRFVEAERPGAPPRVLLSANAAWSRGFAWPTGVAVEILAQASLAGLALGAPGEEPPSDQPAMGLLAGIDSFTLHRPMEPGSLLEAEVEILGRFGRLVKVRGALRDAAGETVAEGGLLLARGD